MLSNDYSMSVRMLMHPKSVFLHYLSASLMVNQLRRTRIEEERTRELELELCESRVRWFNGRDASHLAEQFVK